MLTACPDRKAPTGPRRPRVLYVGGGREAVETLSRAKQSGVDIVHLQDKDELNPATLRYVNQAFLADYRDTDPLVPIVAAMHRAQPFSGVLSLSEDGLVPAARLGEAIGLAWNPLSTVQMLKDKHLMRRHLAEAGFAPVAAARGATVEDIRRFAREHGFPIIVKPIDGAGSLGVMRIDGDPECERAWKMTRKLGLSEFLLEEFLDGVEVSVESFSFAGRHVVLAVTDKLVLPNFVEIGHSIPAQLPHTQVSELTRFTAAFLDVIGLREGPAHTEIKLTRKGLRIVESHNRPGGDRIVELVRQTCGVDMKALTFQWICKRADPFRESPRILKAAAIRYFTPMPGIVRSLIGLAEASSMEGIVELYFDKNVGEEVRPIAGSHDRAGHVVATGLTVEQAIARCEHALRTIYIQIDELDETREWVSPFAQQSESGPKNLLA